MLQKVLIANRGDIAIRVLRACKELGLKTVAVHSIVDENLMHVKLADESVCIGSNNATNSYLNMSAILSAAEITGADAIHPGVGFLSENANFAKIVEAHGLTFIGPSPKHLTMMGDKIIAKHTMEKFGVPTVCGSTEALTTLEQALEVAQKIGYPVILKASSGGGGKGMKVAWNEEYLKSNFNLAKSEAKANFGDDRVYLEKYLTNPRHIEFQIIADKFGNVVSLGERECSIQRNNQKLIEECPSTAITQNEREMIGNLVTNAFRQLGYVGVATVEFLYDNKQFYFMEVNPRLQVEHSITEEITGIDIVKEQILIASGKKLSFKQKDIKINGHAIEFRINAEDPKTFMPSPGKIEELHFPGGNGVRIDSHIYRGYTVPPYYDSLVAKVIVHSSDRRSCLMKSAHALNELVIDGIKTTIDLHKVLVQNDNIINGQFDIHWLENYIKTL